MSTWPHLTNAPITEALVDIRVKLPETFDISQLDAFHDAVKANYPTRREHKQWHGQIAFAANEPPSFAGSSQSTTGYRFDSADGCDIVQARHDGFTFSRLRPYRDWNHLRDKARALWRVYREVTSPLAITRIALRFINRLELPVPIGDFRQWILTTPEVSETLPQQLAGFFMRLQMPFAEPRGSVIITQSIKPGDYTQFIPYIFDIDVFDASSFDVADERMWHRFEELREIKNEVFFRSLTDRTLELYQ